MQTKNFKDFRVEETSMVGIFELVTPTFVDEPKRVDEFRQIKFYTVSMDDQPELSLYNAYLQMEKVLQRELDNIDSTRDWSIYFQFHLFDSIDKFVKTPRYATLEIILNTLQVRQTMITRNSSEKSEYIIANIGEFEDAFKANIGWDRDRENRKNEADNDLREQQGL